MRYGGQQARERGEAHKGQDAVQLRCDEPRPHPPRLVEELVGDVEQMQGSSRVGRALCRPVVMRNKVIHLRTSNSAARQAEQESGSQC